MHVLSFHIWLHALGGRGSSLGLSPLLLWLLLLGQYPPLPPALPCKNLQLSRLHARPPFEVVAVLLFLLRSLLLLSLLL